MMRCCYLRLATAAAATTTASSPEIASAASYDAVVVGGGTAGCLIAGRLAMDNVRTLLLEEGADIRKQRDWYWTLPASRLAHRVAQRGYEATDNVTTPQQWPDGTTAAVAIPTPRVLGGHGVMGSRNWNLGDEADWEGTPWSFREDLLPALRQLENMETFAPHRGKRGRFLICRPQTFSPLYKLVSEAFSVDVPLHSEFTKPSFKTTCGCGRPDTFSDQAAGKAHSSLQRYLIDVEKLNRPITVECGAKVVGVRAAPDSSDKSVTAGVTYRRADGQLIEVNAPMVVLSAGAVGTPRLLAASRGAVRVEASIGQGFWDVPQVVLQYRVRSGNSHNCYLDPLVRTLLRAELRYGYPLLSLRSSWDDLTMYWSSTSDRATPDVEVVFQPFTLNSDGSVPLVGEHGVQFLVRPLRPKSRGKVLADGTIDPAYFTAPEDLACVKKAVAHIQDVLVKRPPLVPILGPLLAIRNESSGISGGGSASAIDAASFQVKGLSNVYACDASILPKPLSGSLLPYTLLLADKCADKLLNKRAARKQAKEDHEEVKTRIVY